MKLVYTATKERELHKRYEKYPILYLLKQMYTHFCVIWMENTVKIYIGFDDEQHNKTNK